MIRGLSCQASLISVVFLCFCIQVKAIASTCDNLQSWQYVELNEDELLISLLKVNGRTASPAFDVLPFKQTYLVPLSGLEDLFRLGWKIDSNLPSVRSGDEDTENNFCSFIIDFSDSTPTTGFYWAEDDFDIYIDIAALPHMLGGNVNYNFNLLQLNFINENAFPGLKSLQGFALTNFTARSETLPDRVVSDRYNLLSPPILNYQVRGNYDSEQGSGRVTGSVNSFFDLANHETELRVSASANNSRQFLRFSKNLDITGDLSAQNFLRYEIGDLQLQSDELIYRSKQALGVSVFNFDPKFSRSFSQVTIEESVLPGWRAQLFRNGQFIEETTTDLDNRVVFTQVETFYGSNFFEIKLYGPEGQQEVREKTINVGKEQLSPGGINYYFNVSDAGKRFIDNDNEASPYDQNISGLISYGINSNMTLEASAHSLSGLDQQQDYLSSALYLNLASSAIKTQYVKDLNAGSAIFTGINSRFGRNLRANFSARYFDNFISDAYPESAELDGEARLRLNGSAKWWGGINWGSSLTHRAYSQRKDSNQASISVSKNLYGGTISSSLEYNGNSVNTKFRQRIFWSKNIAGWQLSNSLQWLPDNNQKVTNFVSNVRWPQKYERFNESRFEYRANNEDQFLFSHRFNWRQKSFNLQLGTSITDGGDWTFSLGISGDIEYDPFKQDVNFYRPRGGSISNIHALAYLDNNRNSLFDDGDDVLSDVEVKGNGFWRGSSTNQQGKMQLATNARKQSISIEEESLPSPFMQPTENLIYVNTHRGGLNTIELPVVTFNDLEGAVYRLKNNNSRGVSGLIVELITTKGEVMAKTETEVDGYFFFTRVPPGEYRLQLEQEYLIENNLSIANLPQSINAPAEGDSLRLNDLLLVQNSELTADIEQTEAPLARQGLNQFYVQLGAFKKPRSIIEVIQHLPTEEYDLNIFRNHNTGLSYVVMGGYPTLEAANSAIAKIKHMAQFTHAYINNGSRYFSSGWSLEYALMNITEHLAASQQLIEQTDGSLYFCQLASYRSLTSIKEEMLNGIQAIHVARRKVNNARYYSVYAGPYGKISDCQKSNIADLTPDQPFALISTQLQQQLLTLP